MLHGQCQLVPGQAVSFKRTLFHWSCIDCAENEPSCNQRCFAVPDVECWTVPREVYHLSAFMHYQELNKLWYLMVSANLHENVKYRSAPRSSGTSARTRIWRFARSRIFKSEYLKPINYQFKTMNYRTFVHITSQIWP